jgi:hypothetical protein
MYVAAFVIDSLGRTVDDGFCHMKDLSRSQQQICEMLKGHMRQGILGSGPRMARAW